MSVFMVVTGDIAGATNHLLRKTLARVIPATQGQRCRHRRQQSADPQCGETLFKRAIILRSKWLIAPTGWRFTPRPRPVASVEILTACFVAGLRMTLVQAVWIEMRIL